MKKWMMIALTLVMTTSMVAPAFAQEAGPRGQGNRQQQGNRQNNDQQQLRKIEEKVLAQLNLTADQQAKIADLNKRFEAEMKELREQMRGQGGQGRQGGQGGARPGAGGPGGRGEADNPMRTKMRELTEKRRTELMKILSKEQGERYTKLMREAMQKLRQERGGQRGGQGRRGGGGDGDGGGQGRRGGGGGGNG